ncbi:NAD(P)H-binding protein [Conexibacter stalactiti]|uniref:NAD(P)H-binding protein n=1 Tax=Conexibacter stalactiti TaxID=1940611 RepID=A0ABU4HPH0_9ACTN|nr:NAD(P)H-binding protein [Conexibacter stalactiti]MDW5595223.1 NAD(P)H-binding protein [Conexibacter stalactiti]MEC5035865.1 NAD(P)H-binding protein [Conexibacter stalactiti]
MSETIAVTGASGAIGGRVAVQLARRGADQRLIVRDAQRAPDVGAHVAVVPGGYGDGPGLREALAGAGTLLLVSATEARDRVAQHRAAVDAARAAGVGRIVYLSFLAAAPDATFTFARDHFETELHVRASGAAFTFLRPSLYADLVPSWVGADGVIRGPAGDGQIAWVTRDDVAAVAAEVLLAGGDHDGRTYDLTGPSTITLAETAALLGERSGRSISYVPETLDEARASRAGSGAEAWEIEGWVTSYAAIATGEMDVVSGAVEQVTGRSPQALAQWLDAHPGSFADEQ